MRSRARHGKSLGKSESAWGVVGFAYRDWRFWDDPPYMCQPPFPLGFRLRSAFGLRLEMILGEPEGR